MSKVTEKVAAYVKEKGINISKMSEAIGVEYCSLYDSLGNSGRGRDLRDYEFVRVCYFIGKNPMDFADLLEEKKAGHGR